MKQPWYKYAIGYEIYPLAFSDSNDDGIGDLGGIINKLDYLKDLGVNLLWICPFFDSPMDDNGYDVSNHFKVNPMYGTNEDFKRLIEEVHNRDMYLIVDFVLNHTSDEHPWFLKAREDKSSPEHDYYIWHEGKVAEDGTLLPPNNWRGFFSDSAWAYDEVAKQYYMKIFSKKMPDLNWENPLLRKEIYKIARAYLDMGVDGFRLDAIAHLARDLSFEDSKQTPDWDGLTLDSSKFSNRDRLFDYLSEFKTEVLDLYPNAFTVGEVGGGSSTATALKYSGFAEGSINMVFNFDTCWENGAYGADNKKDEEIRTNVVNLKRIFAKWYHDCHGKTLMPIYWVNHDHPRVISQYGDPKNYPKESAKMLATLLLFMYGTPFLYQGEEIGMSNVDYTDLNDFKRDVSARNYIIEATKRGLTEEQILTHLRRAARVNARTPMQWKNAPNAGFSSQPTWFKVVNNYETINVKDELSDPDSILNYYKQAIKVRQTPLIQQAVLEGPFKLIRAEHPDVFAYEHYGPTHLFVIGNMRNKEVIFKDGYLTRKLRQLLANYDNFKISGDEITLPPYGAVVYVIED